MRLKWLLMVVLLTSLMMSCEGRNITPMVETSLPTFTATPLAIRTPTQIESSTPTRYSTYDEGQKLVKKLLENNGGCKLPCWWGITPGKTTWAEARQILEKVSLYIGGQESGDAFSMSVHALLPYPHDFAKYMEHSYYIENGIVDYISVYNFDLAPNYFLVNLLDTYGQPTEVWIRTRAKEQMGIQLFIVDVFYQELGVLVEYSTGDPMNDVEGKLQNCLVKEMTSPFIHLWSSQNQILSFQDAKKFIDTTNLPEPKPLHEATGMDVKSFYETFKNPDTDVCLETPKDFWP